jgi:hypothetical protein
MKKGVSLKATQAERMGSLKALQYLLNAVTCVSATNVHKLAYAQGGLAFCAVRCGDWPVAQWRPWQHAICFCLQFDLSGVRRQRKHYVFKSGYQFGEFNHLYNELRESFTKFVSTVVCYLQFLNIQCGLYDSIFHTDQWIFRKKYPAKKDNL